MLLLEQAAIAKQTQEEIQSIQKHHESYVEQTVKKVLRENGVDMQAYFNGSIVGNHCANYAERGESIYSGCYEVLKSEINDSKHCSYLKAFSDEMTKIAALWFEIMRVMKSVDCQSWETIEQFEANVEKLRSRICDLIDGDTPVIPG